MHPYSIARPFAARIHLGSQSARYFGTDSTARVFCNYKDALHTRFQCVVRACDLNCFETRISTYQHDARFMNMHKLVLTP